MFAMNSRFRDHYTKTGLLCTEVGKSKRSQQKLQDQRVSRTERLSTQRNLKGLCGDSDTHKTEVDARKLKLLKWKEEKVNLKKWKEGKEMQKVLKDASEEPIFKCGIVHQKDGSMEIFGQISVLHTLQVWMTFSLYAQCSSSWKYH